MTAIRARFDGKKVILPKKDVPCRPCAVILVFADDSEDADAERFWQGVSEASLANAWDDDEDAVYDKL